MSKFRWALNDSPATAVVLALVACLIWLFAESQTLTRLDVETLVSLESPEGLDRTARWGDGEAVVNVSVTLEGPRSEIDAAAARLRRDGVTVTVGAPGGPGVTPRVYDVDLREAVEAAAGGQLGSVSVRAADPARRPVDVDELLTIAQAPVVFDATGLDLAEAPVLDPPTVRVTGPASVLREIFGEDDAVRVQARLDRAATSALRPGASQRLEARLEIDGLAAAARSRVSIAPGRAGVRLTVRSRVSSLDVATAPVQILCLPSDLARWRITTAQRFVDGLRVTGPSELLQQLESREVSVVAVVRLTSDELQRRVTEKSASYALLTADGVAPLPATVTIEGPDEAIGLTIVAVSEPAETPSG